MVVSPQLLGSVRKVVTPKTLFFTALLFDLSFSINSDEVELYYETPQYVADMLTEAPNLFSPFSSWILKEPAHKYLLSGAFPPAYFSTKFFLLNINY